MVAHRVWNQNLVFEAKREVVDPVSAVGALSSGARLPSPGVAAGTLGSDAAAEVSRRALFASAAGWCLLREVGDPWVIKETQAERWSHPSGFEARARCRACDLGTRRSNRDTNRQRKELQKSASWFSVCRLGDEICSGEKLFYGAAICQNSKQQICMCTYFRLSLK